MTSTALATFQLVDEIDISSLQEGQELDPWAIVKGVSVCFPGTLKKLDTFNGSWCLHMESRYGVPFEVHYNATTDSGEVAIPESMIVLH